MSVYYQDTIRLSGMDVDGRGICKASALLNHLQVAATQAAEEGGFGREVLMGRYGAFWMLARSWFHLKRPLLWQDEITIQTWHRGSRGAMMYRDYDIYVGDELVGESVSGWVLASLETRKLFRLPSVAELSNTDGGSLCKSKTLHKLHIPQIMHEVERRPMRYSDTDINGHVNNTRYADFACDALDMDRLKDGYFLSEMQIGYLAECRPGDVLSIESGEQDSAYYVCGLDKEGKSRFEVELFLGKTLP